MKYFYILPFLIFLSCNSEKILRENTGSDEEIILVIADDLWESEVGNILRGTFSKELTGLPQSEKLFKLIQINSSEFTRFFETNKNIIFVSQNLENTFIRDKWSKEQLVFYLNWNGDVKEFKKNCLIAKDEFYKNEINNILANYQSTHNVSASKFIKSEFDLDIYIPTEYDIPKKEISLFIADFHKFSEKEDLIKKIIVFDFTPRSINIQTEIIQKTDSILKVYILGYNENSFVKIDKRIPVEEKDGIYRGLWKLENGFMGGPFLMKVRYKKDKIVISIGIVFAANKNKRNFIKTFESLL
ncbi:MAG: DUF4837 family protein [Flavobacteriales bacterium]|nr:DUF4837 family protein [Flavobacteriales bacterium]